VEYNQGEGNRREIKLMLDMNSPTLENLIRSAELVYEQKLRQELEATHRDEFVAVEPGSGDFFLGRTLSEAIGAARKAYPDRLAHAMRVGHKAALHFGVHLS
jgi:hypothetical protein